MSFGTLGNGFSKLSSLGGVGKSSLPGLALNSTWAFIGDSILALGNSYNSYIATDLDVGITTWGSLYSGAPFRLPIPANTAISGNTTTDISGRFTTVLSPFSPKLVVMNGGRNDPGVAITAATTISNYTSMFSQMRTLGARGIVIPILPWTGESGPDETYRTTVNAWLATQVAADLKLVNITGFNPATMTLDGTHPNLAGAIFLGQAMSTTIQSMAASGSILPTNPSDPTNLIANDFMTGNGGDPVGTTTGQVANSWRLDNTNAGGATLVGSLVTNPNGGQFQQMVLGGSVTATGGLRTDFSQFQSISGLVQGDKAEAFCEIQIDAGLQNISAIAANFEWYDASFTPLGFSIVPNGSGVILPSGAYSGVMRSDEFVLSTGIPAFFNADLQIVLPSAGGTLPVAASVRIGRTMMRKVS